MNTSERITTGDNAAMPQEVASAMNLLAHPMAGVAAAGAIGFGFASQAFGMWLGAWAGAAEASQRMFEGASAHEPAPKAAKQAPLRLVVSKPAARKPAVQKKPASVSRSSRPVAVDKPASPDDLKAISGVGPKLETVLNGLGIWTYSQLSALGDDEIAWLDDHLGFSGRIVRDDWSGQAKALLASA